MVPALIQASQGNSGFALAAAINRRGAHQQRVIADQDGIADIIGILRIPLGNKVIQIVGRSRPGPIEPGFHSQAAMAGIQGGVMININRIGSIKGKGILRINAIAKAGDRGNVGLYIMGYPIKRSRLIGDRCTIRDRVREII